MNLRVVKFNVQRKIFFKFHLQYHLLQLAFYFLGGRDVLMLQLPLRLVGLLHLVMGLV